MNDTLTYEEFANRLAEELMTVSGVKAAEVKTIDFPDGKRNIMEVTLEVNDQVRPAYRIDNIYADLLSGQYTLEDIFDGVKRALTESISSLTAEELESMTLAVEDYSRIKDHLYVEAMPKDRVDESIIHFHVGDIAFVVRVDLGKGRSFAFYERMLEGFGVTAEQVKEDAVRSYEKLLKPFVLDFPLPCKSFVVRDEALGGAGCMFEKNFMQNLADILNSRFYLVPTSRDEFIVVEDGEETPPEDYLVQVLRDINNNPDLVKADEFLSDNLYYYDRENGLRMLEHSAQARSYRDFIS